MNYFGNLFIAVMGRNPYQVELDKVKEEYEKTAENVEFLRKMYDKMQEHLASDTRRMTADAARIADDAKMISSLQALVENLRTRVEEKDAQIAQVLNDLKLQDAKYKARIASYSDTIAKLQSEKKQGKGKRTEKK